MVKSAQEAEVVRFGPFEMDLRTCWLTRQGQQERLALQPSRLLALLVQRPGELVTREELRSQLWPEETFVDFDHGLNNAVNRVREALRDSATSPKYLQTVPRRGYRFIAEVETVKQAEPEAAFSKVELDDLPHPATAALSPASNDPPLIDALALMRPWRWLAFVVGLAALAALAFLVRSRFLPSAQPIRSLAVLPLQNLSGDAGEEYFANGMTDALITELAQTASLRVVSRTSVMLERGSGKSLRQIASELDVDAVVEGSVARSGGRVRIMARLVDARSDRNLWAGNYLEPMGDVLSLEDRIAREIATQARAALAPPRPSGSKPKRVDPAAYDAYLRGQYFLHLRDAPKMIAYYRQAIALDPGFPAAYAGLADGLTSERVLASVNPPDTEAQALAAARRAIELDPDSGEGYAALGFAELIYSRNWYAGGRDLEKGLALNPNDSFAELQYSIYLDAVGRPDDAVAHMRRALKIDPLSFTVNRHLGSVLYFDRHYEEALLYLERAAEMEPRNFRVVENWRARTYEQLGQFDRAEQSDLLLLAARFSDASIQPLRAAFQRGGWKAYQTARIPLLATQSDLCTAIEIGESYLRLGDRDQAFSSLNRGVDTGCFWYNWLAVDPLLDDLRNDPRFPALLKFVNLPETRPTVGERQN